MLKLPAFSDVKIFRTVADLFKRLFSRAKSTPIIEAVLDEEPADEEADDELPPPAEGIANAVSIHDVLKKLPDYFEDLAALKDIDEDAYGLMAELGGVIVTKDSGFRLESLPDNFFVEPPAFRCLFSSKNDSYDKKKDRYSPSILYMIRMKGSSTYVARQGAHCCLPAGLCYRVVVVFNTKFGVSADSFFVHFDADGKLTLPKERRVNYNVLPAPRAREGRNGSRVFTRWESGIAPMFRLWLEEPEYKGMTAEDLAFRLCCMCLSAKRPQQAILVRANNKDMVASWTIDRRDGKRFFAKRKTGYATDGKRKRILHYVGDFVRDADGRKSYVREHYRGERAFEWMGYHIEVSGLGFHHRDVFDASFVSTEIADGPIPSNMISLKKAGTMLRERYSATFTLSHKH